MFYGDTIHETRQMFFSSWQKYANNEPLLPLENELVQVMLAHPEYHPILKNQEQFQSQNYYPELGETNPFLHMGLHLAIREQIATNRPHGIQPVYQRLLLKYTDALAVEHLMMEQLAECLWLAQKNNMPPEEQAYLQMLSGL